MIYLSIETTGLDPKDFEIVEIAALKIDELKNKYLFHRFIKPQKPLNSTAEAITGLKNDDLNQQKLFGQLKSEIISFIDQQDLIVNNQKFILGFLNQQLGYELTNTVIDLNEIYNEQFPNESSSLDGMLNKFNIKIDTGFSASLNEVLVLPEIYKKLSDS